MHIAIDASRTTVSRVTGTENYAIQLIRALIRQNEHHSFSLYFRDSPPPDLFPISDFVQYRVIPLRRAWTHLRFAAALWRDRPDVTFVPAHTLPLMFPGKAVVTVHDLGFKYFPEAHPTKDRLYLDWTTRYSATRARIILADSAATAHDLNKFYGTPPDKIRVVYPGVEIATPDPAQIPVLRQKYQLPERYLLFVGTLQPRKNIARIVQAYTQSKTDLGLVLAGKPGWLYDPQWTAGVNGVHLPGYIDDADKPALYAGATALIFPTLYEGFGFPVVEAMLCGTPVIASNTSSLPELVGDAGLLVNPEDTHEIAAAITRITEGAALRESLIAKGYIQAQRFTWESAAVQALQALLL